MSQLMSPGRVLQYLTGLELNGTWVESFVSNPVRKLNSEIDLPLVGQLFTNIKVNCATSFIDVAIGLDFLRRPSHQQCCIALEPGR